MLKFELLEDESILKVFPVDAIEAANFQEIASVVDPYIEEHGSLKGLIIEAESFPGWDSFGSFVSHIRFVRDHHKKIKKVAAVTDSGFLKILPSVASHFVEAEVKRFEYSDEEKAMEWIQS